MPAFQELEALKELGFSDAEAAVYLALLETGPTLAGGLIKKTGFHRATTYQVLQRLKEKGLVASVIQNDKQVFEAVHPNRLLDVFEERQQKLEQLLPQLRAKTTKPVSQQEVRLYLGKKGIRSALDGMLSELGTNGRYFDFGVSGLFRKIMGSYWDSWQQRKRKNGIRSRVIFNEEILEKDPELLKDYVGEARFHPGEFASLTDTMIFNDTVILLVWTSQPPIAVVIKNAENAKSYLNQFKWLWKHAKKQTVKR